MDVARLTRYKQWANAKIFDALSALKGRTPPSTDLPVFLRDARIE